MNTGAEGKNSRISLSIIIACYQAERVIAYAVDSAVKQRSDRVELLLVDDGSSDGTVEICRSYTAADSMVRLVKAPHGGAGKARNIGIAQARGEWIGFLDSDDAYAEGSLQQILAYLESAEAKAADIIRTPRLQTDIEARLPLKVTCPEPIGSVCHHLPQLEFWTCLYRRSFLEKEQVRFFEYGEQDVESAFSYRAFSKTERIVTNDRLRFYIQRINPNSNTHQWNRRLMNRIKATVYCRLSRETSVQEDRPFLYGIAVDCAYRATIRWIGEPPEPRKREAERKVAGELHHCLKWDIWRRLSFRRKVKLAAALFKLAI